MAPLSFEEARACVLRTVLAARRTPGSETVGLDAACGRVLAKDITADRDMPPLPRSLRDGFAIRSADVPGTLRVIGEVRAGERWSGSVGPGDAVEIMTGAPVPDGADAVVMVEHVTRGERAVTVHDAVEPGLAISPAASEARRGETLLRAGRRLDYAGVALLAATGRARVSVYVRPRAAILPTGDEIVDVEAVPAEHQVRNSNAWSLAAQVRRAGAVPVMLPPARDNADHTRELIEKGLQEDLLLLSGGVSAGKYDVVEPALAACGARFYFDRVRIQPGQPLVFGEARDKFFFGLPGNPASTMVTFELFGRAALDLLGGADASPLEMPWARLTKDFRHKPGLTRFLPAKLSADGGEVEHTGWGGSGDVPSVARADAYLVAEADRPEYKAGEWIRVLRK